jgi:hypothetical protein
MNRRDRSVSPWTDDDGRAEASRTNEYGTPSGEATPGKRSLTGRLYRKATRREAPPDPGAVAARAFQGTAHEVPHRERMEQAFGRDFSDVKVYYDGDAADRLGAAGFTVGNQVVLPGPDAGPELVAHELTHVVQQEGAAAGLATKAEVSDPSDAAEVDADRIAAIVASGGSAVGLVQPDAGGAPVARKRAEPKTEIPATEEALGEHVAAGMDKVNRGVPADRILDEGVHYAPEYRKLCDARGEPHRWKDDYDSGHADPAYWERTGYMRWMLKPKVSASAGIKAWLEGLTIAECYSVLAALETDALRAAIGDKRFDDLFGSVDAEVSENSRLVISAGVSSTIERFTKKTEAAELQDDSGGVGNRPAKVGDWYYFGNHPKYLFKHPAGFWQGENVIYRGRNAAGEQIWSGFGASDVTEDALFDKMVEYYNAPRSDEDRRKLEQIKAAHGGKLPPEYDPSNFPDKIDKHALFAAQPVEIDGEIYEGGFDVKSGERLDVEKIKPWRPR